MFTPQQYRSKAAQYTDLAKTASNPAEALEYQALERSFTVLADNEQWLADNHSKTVHSRPISDSASGDVSAKEDGAIAKEGDAFATEEEHVLRCLGAALIMQWNTLPRKLQRELFDNAGAMGDLLETGTLRGQVARFLHKHEENDSRARGV
jgi:hypothetical protein